SRAGDITITPASSSGSGTKVFKTTGGSSQATFTISAGSSSVSFLYYDETSGSYTITLSNNASSPTLYNPSGLTFTINAAAASKLAYTSATNSATAGVN